MEKSGSGCGLAAVWFTIGAIVAAIPCFIAGGVAGNLQVYRNILIEESDAAIKLRDANPDFKGLSLSNSSQGTVGFSGKVANQEVYSKLEAAVIDQFGRMELEGRMRAVKVANANP